MFLHAAFIFLPSQKWTRHGVASPKIPREGSAPLRAARSRPAAFLVPVRSCLQHPGQRSREHGTGTWPQVSSAGLLAPKEGMRGSRVKQRPATHALSFSQACRGIIHTYNPKICISKKVWVPSCSL